MIPTLLRWRSLLPAAVVFALTGAAQAQEPIKIGWLSSLTGPLSSAAIAENQGVQFAVEEVNKAGGINGRKIELITRDTGGEPTKAVNFAQQLAFQEKVHFIIGPVNSGESLATVPIVAKAGLPNLIIGTVDELTRGFIGIGQDHDALAVGVAADHLRLRLAERAQLVGHAPALRFHPRVDGTGDVAGQRQAPQPHVDDLDADVARILVRLLARRGHDLVALGRDRLVHRALVELLGEVRAHRLRETAAGGLLVALHGDVVLLDVLDPPQHDEVHLERRLLRRDNAVDVGVVHQQVAPGEEAHVLHQRDLEVQAGLAVDVDDLAQLELDRPLGLLDRVDRLRRDETISEFPALVLFAERARAACSDFAWNAGNIRAVASICLQLDGLPLAIELIAARVKTLSVQQIAARLDDRFALLTSGSRSAPSRQQTLRAALDWSYELLTETEKELYRQISVFAGGFSLDALESVALLDSDRSLLDTLSRLVDKSLLLVEQQDQPRYRFLEPIRQYARDKLNETRGDDRSDPAPLCGANGVSPTHPRLKPGATDPSALRAVEARVGALRTETGSIAKIACSLMRSPSPASSGRASAGSSPGGS